MVYSVCLNQCLPESTITIFMRASSLIVLVESVIEHKILHKNIEKLELQAIFQKKCARNVIVLLLAINRGIDSE